MKLAGFVSISRLGWRQNPGRLRVFLGTNPEVLVPVALDSGCCREHLSSDRQPHLLIARVPRNRRLLDGNSAVVSRLRELSPISARFAE